MCAKVIGIRTEVMANAQVAATLNQVKMPGCEPLLRVLRDLTKANFPNPWELPPGVASVIAVYVSINPGALFGEHFTLQELTGIDYDSIERQYSLKTKSGDIPVPTITHADFELRVVVYHHLADGSRRQVEIEAAISDKAVRVYVLTSQLDTKHYALVDGSYTRAWGVVEPSTNWDDFMQEHLPGAPDQAKQLITADIREGRIQFFYDTDFLTVSPPPSRSDLAYNCATTAQLGQIITDPAVCTQLGWATRVDTTDSSGMPNSCTCNSVSPEPEPEPEPVRPRAPCPSCRAPALKQLTLMVQTEDLHILPVRERLVAPEYRDRTYAGVAAQTKAHVESNKVVYICGECNSTFRRRLCQTTGYYLPGTRIDLGALLAGIETIETDPMDRPPLKDLAGTHVATPLPRPPTQTTKITAGWPTYDED